MIFEKFVVNYFPVLNNSIFKLKKLDPQFIQVMNNTAHYIDPIYNSSVVETHPILSILLFLFFVLVIGEILFIRNIKKNKIKYQLKNEIDKEIKDRKIKCFLLSLIWTVILSYGMFFLIFILILFLIIVYVAANNSIAIVFNTVQAIIIIGFLYYTGKYLFKIVYYFNKGIVKNIVKVETEKEYLQRQKKYKIKDGEEVKLKSNLKVNNHYGAKEFTKAKLKNKGKVLIVHHHLDEHDDQMRCNEKNTGKRCEGIYTDEMLEVLNKKRNK